MIVDILGSIREHLMHTVGPAHADPLVSRVILTMVSAQNAVPSNLIERDAKPVCLVMPQIAGREITGGVSQTLSRPWQVVVSVVLPLAGAHAYNEQVLRVTDAAEQVGAAMMLRGTDGSPWWGEFMAELREEQFINISDIDGNYCGWDLVYTATDLAS